MDITLETRIREAAKRLIERGAREVYVFGSFTTGRLRPDSDIDLGVVGLPAKVFFRAMAEVSRIVERPVDLVALDRDDEVTRSLRSSGDLRRVG
jgi:predicted nucleotidyltransferase